MKDIFVTQPYLPPLNEFTPFLEQIWKNRILTNGGPFHQQFEEMLCEFLGVQHISLFTNATLALVTALQSLRITGEVITTPYSFVATSHSLLWNGIAPVFVDIDPITLNLDPSKIEAAITPNTTAILPVHCYGNPCDVQRIQEIADNYNLKVIYDAAHAFGVQYRGASILQHGDLSILSFHATKILNTFEGGAIISHDRKTKVHIDHLKNFGYVDEVTVVSPGINGKMSEFNAALGVLQLRHFEEVRVRRQVIDSVYRDGLSGVKGISLLRGGLDTSPNHAYFAIMVEDDFASSRDELYEELKNSNIFARRYFFPLISEFPMYRSLPSANRNNLAVAHDVSRKILCLPIYPDLQSNEQERVISAIMNIGKCRQLPSDNRMRAESSIGRASSR
jgi:dTDP-4-amino-4,6-dideoxygalactose transaminase